MSTIAYGTPASPRLRITPRGRAVLAALIAAPLLALAWFGLGAPAARAGDTPATTTTFTYVSIEPGQSLWQLAGQVAPQADPREVVDSIVTLNNLPSADVQPGQELAIPPQYAP
ncbi:MAG TPA: LysM peptidoglycan-binding domain-containing protein [Pseudolysinimonas sp.]|nr:LysM peptidoglycan-binding domain-containing protein [Pseudolysinimonas sp.]